MNWYSTAKRDLPWRNTRDPYKIWLSEIILQQTRVDQGLDYYNRFVEHFPTVSDLALASERQVLKLWEGLGYYSRARNLHATAKHVHFELGGVLPCTYVGLLSLKGVGPYTAAAIASIAFGLPEPVIDGNVFRFASRYFGIEKDISKVSSRSFFLKILKEVIPSENAAMFNQAMMEHGAMICKPAPNCASCHFREDCYARKKSRIQHLPIKTAKTKVTEVHMHYFIYTDGEHTAMRVRDSAIWQGLYEFELIEAPAPECDVLEHVTIGKHIKSCKPVKHLLSHRRLWVSFHEIKLAKEELEALAKQKSLNTFSWKEVLTLPKPKVILNYLEARNH